MDVEVIMHAQFFAIAQDPRIIPGVHHYCDEWCDYCPVTRRCLGFLCVEAFRRDRGRTEAEETFANVDEAFEFTRQLAAIEGRRTDELDELLAHPPGQSGVRTDDPLAERALDYAARAELLLLPIALRLASRRSSRSPFGLPSPEEVAVWYHLRIYMTMFRALVSAASDCAGGRRSDDARGCAKLAMVSIDRSRVALEMLRATFGADQVDPLIAILAELDRGMEQRFPDARAFVRPGLDCPVA
jgi:hypothetical protein